jgi:hypothetical protein
LVIWIKNLEKTNINPDILILFKALVLDYNNLLIIIAFDISGVLNNNE